MLVYFLPCFSHRLVLGSGSPSWLRLIRVCFLNILSLFLVSIRLPVQALPQINLDAFKVCLFQQWRPGEISFVTIAVAFGTSRYHTTLRMVSTSISDILSLTPLFTFQWARLLIDAFALCSAFVTTGGSSWRRYPGIPTLLSTILRDATIYFFAMFACQLLLLFFLFLAPVG
jgi:hypothetical protein